MEVEESMAGTVRETSNHKDSLINDFKNSVTSNELYLEEMTHKAGDKIGNVASDIQHKTSEYLQTGRAYVKENPVKGVAMAAAFGAVAGGLVTLLMSPRE
jgi:ElaB/YqjD/DUF883 family membrane-anchored ribosome-binding protein